LQNPARPRQALSGGISSVGRSGMDWAMRVSEASEHGHRYNYDTTGEAAA